MKVLRSPGEVDRLAKPDPRKHGLLPFVIKRLKHLQPEIEKAGHKIRFAVARGPLNIASFLMGTPEFLEAMKTEPERMHQLLTIVTDFLVDWIAYQREQFPTIDGIFLLDDIVGFVGRRDFETLCAALSAARLRGRRHGEVLPLRRALKAGAPMLEAAGINLLNFGIQHTVAEMKAWTNHEHRAGGQHSAARRAGGRHAGRCGAGRARDACAARRPLAADRLLRRRHAARTRPPRTSGR